MTDQELLQQAKDQVAEETRLMKPWSQIVDDNHSSGHFIERLMDHVCKKAIQSAREESWIDVGDDNLPAKGQEILMLCPKENGKGFYHCVGFYSRWREHEADVDDDDVPGIDYDVEAGIAWITEGFYEEEEQYKGEHDTHYVQRYPVKWRKLTAPGR